ncbi:MAG: PH domain-containing protein [Opitutae bacterium]|nr:PH domain-containing protein [Opitutae bacterium]
MRQLVLRYLRVPAEPEPPFGAPGSVRVFRAGRNYYRLRLLRWLVGQIGAAVGIAFSLMFIDYIQGEVDALRAAHAKAQQTQQAAPATTPPTVTPSSEPQVTGANPIRRVPLGKTQRNGQRAIVQTLEHWPWWVFPLMHIFEYGALALFVAQIPFSYAIVRLEFEQHWYIVTDRSLRIRTGLFSLQESTMSFANLQQVQVQQGPLQRLLRLADVHVQSAGGGGDHEHEGGHDSLHTGIFHSVENAPEIRDLILERLRLFRATGLGDPDDPHQHATAAAATTSQSADALAAARELLTEARALRQAVG